MATTNGAKGREGMAEFEKELVEATKRGTKTTPACILRALDSSGEISS